MKNNLIAISGKINSGKDTVAKIIQILSQSPHFTNKAVIEFLDRKILHPVYENKKFADILKDFICMLLGCTREQLEDREFKEKELPNEWSIFYLQSNNTFISGKFISHQEAIDYHRTLCKENNEWDIDNFIINPVKLTPRKLLQLMGTECGRNILHPDIWVNALFSNYVSVKVKNELLDEKTKEASDKLWKIGHLKESNWIITDVRFPNELQAIKDRSGINIRVNRPCVECGAYNNIACNKCSHSNLHESETALDNAEFDIVIENNSTLDDLINKVRELKII